MPSPLWVASPLPVRPPLPSDDVTTGISSLSPGTEALVPRGSLVLRVSGRWLLSAHSRRPSLPLHRRGSPTDRPQHPEWLSRSNLVGSVTFSDALVKRTCVLVMRIVAPLTQASSVV